MSLRIDLNPESIQERIFQMRDSISQDLLQNVKKTILVTDDIELEAMQVSENAFQTLKSKVESEFLGNQLILANIFVGRVKTYFYSPNFFQKQLTELALKL